MPAKACQWFYNDFTLFSALPVLFNMYTDKDSNLINDLGNYSPYELTFGRKPKLLLNTETDPDIKVLKNFKEFMIF